MLRILLERLAQGDVVDFGRISRENSVSTPVVSAGLEFLTRLGYIERVEYPTSSGCGGTCSGCTGCGVPHMKGGDGFWQITQAGREVVAGKRTCMAPTVAKNKRLLKKPLADH